jgi:hypothetical protein
MKSVLKAVLLSGMLIGITPDLVLGASRRRVRPPTSLTLFSIPCRALISLTWERLLLLRQ